MFLVDVLLCKHCRLSLSSSAELHITPVISQLCLQLQSKSNLESCLMSKAIMVLLQVFLGLLLVHADPNSAEDTLDVRADEGSLKQLDMRDFDPGDLYTFEVQAKGQMEFFVSLQDMPQVVSILYLVSSKETNDVDLVVRDPSKKVIRQFLKRKDAAFKFRAEATGEYTLVFMNRKVKFTQIMEKLTITLALHIGSTSGQVLHKEDVTAVESNLLDMHRQLGQFRMEQQISEMQQEAHFQSNSHAAVQSANRKVLWFSLVECAGVVGLSVWQVYYIKQLLNNKRIL